jgi:GNAT superfamily N-acetyltransferase
MLKVSYELLTAKYYPEVIVLANEVHGDGYLDKQNVAAWVAKGICNKINTSFVALLDNKVIGFRITFSAQQWQIDKWCSPLLWNISQNACCYFKCNTVNEKHRGLGVGKQLLTLSINAAKQQGAQAGISHLWKQSPNNSAVSYFTKCGGELVKTHADKWNEESIKGYNCILCGRDCHCEAAEMIIYFK